MNVYYTASLYQTPKILDNFQKTLVELKKKNLHSKSSSCELQIFKRTFYHIYSVENAFL